MNATSPDVASLAKTYGPAVFRTAWRVLGSRTAAEDVQQQLFLKLLESPPRDVMSWPAYLTASAVRLSIDVLRRQHRLRILAALWSRDDVADPPDEDAERAEASRFMRAALARLNPRDASCFVLRHVHGLEVAAIAASLGISENYVSVSVHRARKALEAMQSQEQSS